MPQTIGEERVRYDFNPTQNPDVELIKRKTAELIDICSNIMAHRPQNARQAAVAMTAYEDAAMWAVKAAT